jgi:alpha-N-acetylglucosaminidase
LQQTARNFSGDHMIGVGITMEGINQNEIMYEFALEQSWRSPLNETELSDWLVGFATHRYTNNRPVPASVIATWQLLGHSVYYKNPYGDDSIMLRRPRLYRTQEIDFNLQSLFSAWEYLVDASNEFNSDLFQYDLVDITKDILQYKFASTYTQLMLAYNQSDLYGVATQSSILVDVLADTELVLASDRRFLLGNWIQDALQFAQSEEETHFYNFNAKLQVSIWGNNYTLELYDYANKFWSGMIRDYYAPRWNVFFDLLLKSLIEGQPLDAKLLNERLFTEAELPFFMLDTKSYPTTTQGDSIAIVRQLYNKYHPSLNEIYLPRRISF